MGINRDRLVRRCRYKVKLGHSHFVDQEHLIPARMLRVADEKAVELGRMRGEIV